MSHEDLSLLAGPIKNPVDRFAHLPEPTREFLERLREDDIAELKEAIRFYHSVRTFGKVSKWLIIVAVSSFVGAVQFGEAIVKALAYISRGKV